MRNLEFNTLILPVADSFPVSERCAPVLEIANGRQAKLVLVSVIDRLEPSMEFRGMVSHYALLEYEEKRETERLTNIRNALAEDYRHIVFEIKVLVGKPFVKLIELANECDADLIVLDALHENHNSRNYIGSTVKHLMRKSNVPIWSIAATQYRGVKNIVAAVDIEPGSQEGRELNRSIIVHAHNLAEFYQAKLTVFHAWRLYGEGFLRKWQRKTDLDIAVMAKEEKTLRENLIAQLVEDLQLPRRSLDICLEEGEPETLVPEYVQSNDVDLLIMGSVCRTGIPGFFIGNTAENILDTVQCSVVSIKPDGFHSPVVNVANR